MSEESGVREPEVVVDVFRLPVDTGELTFAWFVFLLFVAPTGLAMSNVAGGIGLIPSLIWLALVGFLAAVALIDAATSDCPAAVLCALTPFHELQLRRSESGRLDYCEVTQLGPWTVVRSRSELARLESLSWRRGQASARVGRDMDDWRVLLSFGPPASPKSEFERTIGQLRGFGPSSPREDTAALGEQVADWLIANGVKLARAKAEDDFAFKCEEGFKVVREHMGAGARAV